MAVYLPVLPDVEEILSRARNVRDQISVLADFISEQQDGINKWLSCFGVIVGAIITAIFTVQVVDRSMRCATSWTLPVLITTTYVGTIAAIVPMAYRQYMAFDIRRRLVRQLNMSVDVSSVEGAVLKRNDPPLFELLRSTQMEVNLKRRAVSTIVVHYKGWVSC
ncbi:hypothetical protein SUGI_1113980 [Cryptomeria japonica]|nr:hypothetical protein SUGI_1113980 [Cryptomeria japonica]